MLVLVLVFSLAVTLLFVVRFNYIQIRLLKQKNSNKGNLKAE